MTTPQAQQRELIWITGASQGIGKSLALTWVQEGHTVVISARNQQALEAVREQADIKHRSALSGNGNAAAGQIVVLPCDITDQTQVRQSIQQLLVSEGLPDRIILNAGTHKPFPAHQFSAETLQQLVQVNLIGAGFILEEILPLYLKTRPLPVEQTVQTTGPDTTRIAPDTRSIKGQIALVASVAGYRGLPTASAYGATKAAMINMAESLRAELCHTELDIRLINPGFVQTPLTDKNDFAMPFLISAEQAACDIIKGLNSKRFEIVFPTRMAMVMSLLKWLPDRLFFPLINRSTGQASVIPDEATPQHSGKETP